MLKGVNNTGMEKGVKNYTTKAINFMRELAIAKLIIEKKEKEMEIGIEEAVNPIEPLPVDPLVKNPYTEKSPV